MGCCGSTVSASPNPAQNPNNNNVNSSSEAINSAEPGPQAANPRPSTNNSNQSGPQQRPAPRQPRDLTKHPTKDLRLHVWKSQKRTWTRAQIDEERVAFFDTRTSGRQEIWQAIRTALEILWAGGGPEDNDGGLATAQVILKAAGVTIPSGDMAGSVYDGFGARYELPAHIVSDPINLLELPTRSEDDEAEKSEAGDDTSDEDGLSRRKREEIRRGKAVVNPDDLIDIRVKLSDRDSRPLVITINKEDSVKIVAKKIFEESGLEAPLHIRIVYLGKVLKENKTLQEQHWKDDHVLNAMVMGENELRAPSL